MDMKSLPVRRVSIVCVNNPEWGTWGVVEDCGGSYVIRNERGDRVLDKDEAARFWRVAQLRIEGERREGALHVTINGQPLTVDRSLKVWNHSPTGFECGYAGSGPAQLALAILLAAGIGDRDASDLHQRFKRDFVQYWHAPFTVDLDVGEWVRAEKGRTS